MHVLTMVMATCLLSAAIFLVLLSKPDTRAILRGKFKEVWEPTTTLSLHGEQTSIMGEEIVHATYSSQDLTEFAIWAVKHGKVYTTRLEAEQRLRHFLESKRRVEAHKLLQATGQVSHELGLTVFADMSDDEFMEHFNLNSLTVGQECSATEKRKKVSNDDTLAGQVAAAAAAVPSRIDWREKQIVSPVKNQGHCGSCWTFSTTGALEAHWKKKTGKDVNLSEQQLLDCATNYDNHGCNGGLPSHAFQYLAENRGLDTEKAYPYMTAQGPSCQFKPWGVGARVKGVVNITQFDEKELMQAVGLVGPVSVAFQVASDFRLYTGGVYTSSVCGNKPTDVNHAVLAVGYDTSIDGVPYWIIKNSWGEQWGNSGYFWMQRGVNMCGVSDCASYPVV